jgi:hypothetical protein
VEAGWGWSMSKGECGAYMNMNCDSDEDDEEEEDDDEVSTMGARWEHDGSSGENRIVQFCETES